MKFCARQTRYTNPQAFFEACSAEPTGSGQLAHCPPQPCIFPDDVRPGGDGTAHAQETRDRAAMKFVDWYLKEQVEEEASVGGVLATLKLIGDDKKALLLLDKDLATRTFTAPVIG